MHAKSRGPPNGAARIASAILRAPARAFPDARTRFA